MAPIIRAKAILMTDEEANDAFLERAERLKLNCCVCESEGWSIHDEYVPERNMIVSSCTLDHHSVCIRCFSTLATKELKDHLLLGKKMKRIVPISIFIRIVHRIFQSTCMVSICPNRIIPKAAAYCIWIRI